MKPAPRRVSVRNLHPGLRVDARSVARAIRTLDAHHGDLAGSGATPSAPDELGVVFMTDAGLAGLHARFLSDPSTTDVITFEGEPALGSGGEICVSADAAARYAAGRGRAFADEMALYVVHGWLHLAGHDDIAPAARRAMRRAETRALAVLRRTGTMPLFAAPKKTRAIGPGPR